MKFLQTCTLLVFLFVTAQSQNDTLSFFSQERMAIIDGIGSNMDFRGNIYKTHKIWTPVTVAVGTIFNYWGLATLEKELSLIHI